MTNDSLLANRTDFCEFRILLNLYSPTLIISKMPMKSVEFVDLHNVEISLDGIYAEEMS